MLSEMIAEFFALFSIKVDKNATGDAEKETEKIKKSVEKIGFAAKKVEETISELKHVVGAYLGMKGIEKIFEVNSELGTTYAQLVNATGSSKLAAENLEQIKQFADKSKLSIMGLAESFGPFQNQMMAAGLSSQKSIELFEKMQIAYSGAGVKNQFIPLIQRDIDEFISGSVSLDKLKGLEFGKQMPVVLKLMREKVGGKTEKEKDENIKKMSSEQRAELIADVSYEKYAKGAEEYLKGPAAAWQNLKNKLTEFSDALGKSGFTDSAISALNGLSGALSFLIGIVDSAKSFIKGIRDAFNECPEVIGTVTGALGMFILAMNTERIAGYLKFVKELISWKKKLRIANIALAISEFLASAPLWLIVAGYVALISIISLLVEDIYGYFHGKKSVTGIVVNSLKSMFESLHKWFVKIGASISRWYQQQKAETIKYFHDIGASAEKKLTDAFTNIKKKAAKIFADIKGFFHDNISAPIEKVWDKISGLAGLVSSPVNDMAGTLATNGMSGQDYFGSNSFSLLSQPSMMAPLAPIQSTQITSSPTIQISIPSVQGMNEKQLGIHIGEHVEKALNNHINSALMNSTRRE